MGRSSQWPNFSLLPIWNSHRGQVALPQDDVIKRAALAAIARDKAGAFLGASTMVMKGVDDPEVLEAMACREGMSLATDL
jgi:hypothetical protein